MDTLYIPTSTLNFNNILACESLSPISHYELRGFGYKRFTPVQSNSYANSIILYSKIPILSINDNALDNYPLIIEVPIESVQILKEPIQVEGIRIFQTSSTIYLDPFTTRFYFRTKYEMELTLSKSLQSLETKMVEIYRTRFLTIEETENKTFVFSDTLLSAIADFLPNIQSIIARDIAINKAKGLIYGYFCGAISARSPEVIKLLNTYQQYRNHLSSLINLCQNKIHSKSPSSKKIGHSGKKDNIEIQARVIELKEFTRELRYQLRHFENLEELVIEKFLKNHHQRFNIIDLLDFLKHCKPDNTSLYDRLEYALGPNTNMVLPKLDEIYKTLQVISSDSVSDEKIIYSKLEMIQNFMTDAQKRITKYGEQKTMVHGKPEIGNSIFYNNNLKITHINDDFLNEEERKISHHILNILLEQHISGSDEFKQNRVNICVNVGKLLKSVFGDTFDGRLERDYINRILDHLETLKSLDITSFKSFPLQSFAAFIVKGDDPERMLDYLMANSVNDSRLSLAMWGAVFGFANMPRTITDIFFKQADSEYLDSYMKMLNTALIQREFVIPEFSSISDITFSVTKSKQVSAKETTETALDSQIDTSKESQNHYPIPPEYKIVTEKAKEMEQTLNTAKRDVEGSDKSHEFINKYIQAIRNSKPKKWKEIWYEIIEKEWNEASNNTRDLFIDTSGKENKLEIIYKKFISEIEHKNKLKEFQNFGPAKVDVLEKIFRSIIKDA